LVDRNGKQPAEQPVLLIFEGYLSEQMEETEKEPSNVENPYVSVCFNNPW